MADKEDLRGPAQALAGGVIAVSLIETLVDRGSLTLTEAQGVLKVALDALGPHHSSPLGYEAIQVVTGLMRERFSERK